MQAYASATATIGTYAEAKAKAGSAAKAIDCREIFKRASADESIAKAVVRTTSIGAQPRLLSHSTSHSAARSDPPPPPLTPH